MIFVENNRYIPIDDDDSADLICVMVDSRLYYTHIYVYCVLYSISVKNEPKFFL